MKLTDEGRRALRGAEQLAKHVDERVLDALPTRHREQFISSSRDREYVERIAPRPKQT